MAIEQLTEVSRPDWLHLLFLAELVIIKVFFIYPIFISVILNLIEYFVEAKQ